MGSNIETSKITLENVDITGKKINCLTATHQELNVSIRRVAVSIEVDGKQVAVTQGPPLPPPITTTKMKVL